MFKVVSAEIKKILSKPSIYVLAVILAAILVLGVFIYKPNTTPASPIVLNGSTYTDKYADFTHSEGGLRKVINDQINASINNVNNYKVIVNKQAYTKQEYIDSLYQNVIDSFNSYRNCSTDGSQDKWIASQKEKLVTNINALDSQIVTSVGLTANGSYSLVTTTENYENYVAVMKQLKTWANVTVKKENLSSHCKDFDTIYKPELENCLNSFVYPTLSQTFIKDYTNGSEGTKLYTLRTRLAEINATMDEKFQLANKEGIETNMSIADEMDKLANLYSHTANVYLNMLKYELLANAFEFTNTTQELDLMHLKDYSAYNINSLKIKYTYIFENNEIEENFARPLTIGTTSNNDINAYDYAYFILKLFSFVIIAYCAMLACHSIAGEIKDGSMRYFAIRPVSRTEIYFGKLIAIMILATILIVFSGIVAILVGGFVYNFETLNILTIFNGTTPIVVHPITMILILLASLIIEAIIYTSIALLLSALIKSDLLAITVVLLLYLVNILLPLFIQGSNTWLSFYPFSHISLYPLFGSAVYSNSNFFNLLLGAKVYATTSFMLTLCVIVALIVILNFITSQIFKHKEL